MPNIIIVGTSDYCKDIEMSLSKRNTIVGYIEYRRYKFRRFLGAKNIVQQANIPNDKDNVFLIAYYDDNLILLAKKDLTSKGIEESKIVVYKEFKDTIRIDTLKEFGQTSCAFDNFVFGMSHARSDILINSFLPNTFSFASPSLDLFCHFYFLEYLIKNENAKLLNAKKIFLEIPYYIFDYDLSRHSSFVKTKLIYFYRLNNYHNFMNTICIKQFSLFYSLFIDRGNGAESLQKSVSKKSSSVLKNRFYHLVDMIRIRKKCDSVWKKEYESTALENKAFLKSFVNICKARGIELVVFVCPYNPIFRKSFNKTVNAKKNRFYNIINELEIKNVYDFFESINDHNLFLDHCHLNNQGASIFTDLFLNRLSGEQ